MPNGMERRDCFLEFVGAPAARSSAPFGTVDRGGIVISKCTFTRKVILNVSVTNNADFFCSQPTMPTTKFLRNKLFNTTT